MDVGRTSVYEHLMQVRVQRGGGFLLLIDPDRTPERTCIELAESSADCGVDAILVGTSFMLNTNFAQTVRRIKSATTSPVLIFPGSFAQVTPDADAVLFTSLVSGRNPNYLIDEQVRGAPLVKRFGLEAIPTGYMLISSGSNPTSVQYISDTQPIPHAKHDIACAHALACQYLGMKLAYLEAGSGATQPVPTGMVRDVADYIDIPVIVGGGLTTPEACAERIAAGAAFVVVGTQVEHEPDPTRLSELASAAHPKETVGV